MTDILPPAGWPNVRQLETNEFATGGANGNMNEQAKSLAARSELLKQYAALPYESKTGGYALNERVQIATGDIVRSTIASNVNNPNVDMTGWFNPLNARMRTVDSFSDLLTTSPKYAGEVVLLLSHTSGKYKGGGQFKHDPSKLGQDDGGTVANGWVRVDLTLPQPEWFGASGDGVRDDTAEVKKAVALGKNRLRLVSDYVITDTIVFEKNFFSVTGLDKNSTVQNRCVGKPCFKFITKEYTEVRNLKIWGNGGAFGVGATVGEAIVYENAPHFNIVNCNIRYNGAGVKCIGGAWNIGFVDTEIEHNLGIGIDCVSISGAAWEQTGNAFNLRGGSISVNGGDGIRWKASSICVTGTTIEANKGKGFVVDNTGLTNSVFGIFFSGNYMENNVQGELLFKSDTGVIITDVVILGNYFYSIQNGPTAFIKFEGPIRSNRNVYVGPNACAFGGTVQNLVDGGNSLREDCYIQAGEYPCINLGYAKLTQGYKTKTLFGKSACVGATWSTPDLSDNFHSATSKNIYFDIPLKSNDLLERIQFLIVSNTTAQYSVNAYLMKKDTTSIAAATTVYSITLQSEAAGGNKLFTFSTFVANNPVRLDQGFHYYLRLTISGMATGSETKISNPIIRYV